MYGRIYEARCLAGRNGSRPGPRPRVRVWGGGRRPPALGPKLDAFQTNVTGLLGPIATRMNQLATADALTGSVAGLSTEVTTLRGQVSKLRKQMTPLRKLIVKRLPKR